MSLALIALVIGFGVLVGVLSALFGVGGGIVMVPFMVLVLDKSQHLAEGTSLLVIIATAAAGVFALRNSGYVFYRHAAVLGLGGAIGAVLGALLAIELSADLLEDIFAAFVVLMGVRMIVQTVRHQEE